MAANKPELPEISFRNSEEFTTWLSKNHASSSGIWLCFAKKNSGIPSISLGEAVEAALCFGWIDGQARRKDERTFFVRYGPRAKRSIWSRINREKIAVLIDQGRMQPAGLREVERAQQDGRWDAAYDSARTATVPPDLQAALDADTAAKAFFATLNAQNRYAILFRLQIVKRPETRVRKIENFVTMLREQRKLYP